MVRGVIFDLDGVIADTERLQWAAYRRVLAELGVDVGIEEYRREWIATGRGPEYACRTYNLSVTPDDLRARKADVYLTLLKGGVRPCPGVPQVLARLAATHRLALATNTARAEVAYILAELAADGHFHAIVAREDYERAKPAPDAYLAAARSLGVAPADCAVVEDTTRGVRAGLAAGMRVIAVPNELTFDNDFTSVSCRLAHLDQLTAELLRTLA